VPVGEVAYRLKKVLPLPRACAAAWKEDNSAVRGDPVADNGTHRFCSRLYREDRGLDVTVVCFAGEFLWVPEPPHLPVRPVP
jgi:hypothetical protein